MKLILATALIVSASVTAVSADSAAYITQLGFNVSSFEIDRIITVNNLALPVGAMAESIQTVRDSFAGGSGSISTVAQTGSEHLLQVTQSGRGNIGLITQEGRGNASLLTQAGSNNIGLIAQLGYGNSVNLTQTGANHSAIVTQQGSGNVAIIHQR